MYSKVSVFLYRELLCRFWPSTPVWELVPSGREWHSKTKVTEPAHRKMLDDLIIVNHWERPLAEHLGSCLVASGQCGFSSGGVQIHGCLSIWGLELCR